MITVEELMTTQLYTLRQTHSVHDARKLMADHKIRHVVVVDEKGMFLGLLSQRDVLAAAVSTFADISNVERDELETGIPLLEILHDDVIVAEEGTDLLNAARFMLETKHGCLPVVSGGYVKGILTEADFVRLSLELLEKMAMYEQAYEQSTGV